MSFSLSFFHNSESLRDISRRYRPPSHTHKRGCDKITKDRFSSEVQWNNTKLTMLNQEIDVEIYYSGSTFIKKSRYRARARAIRNFSGIIRQWWRRSAPIYILYNAGQKYDAAAANKIWDARYRERRITYSRIQVSGYLRLRYWMIKEAEYIQIGKMVSLPGEIRY